MSSFVIFYSKKIYKPYTDNLQRDIFKYRQDMIWAIISKYNFIKMVISNMKIYVSNYMANLNNEIERLELIWIDKERKERKKRKNI